MCFQKGCAEYRKSIRRERIEGAFAALLDQLTPSPKLVALVPAMFKRAWDQRTAQARVIAQAYEREVAKIDGQIESLLDRIVEPAAKPVIAAYEKRIAELERAKLVLREKQDASGRREGMFEELFELAFAFLANPGKLWLSGRLELQRLVLRLTFADRLAYSQIEGFRTPKTTMPFSMLGDSRRPFDGMAERESGH